MDPYQLAPIETSIDSETFDYVQAELLIPVRYTGPLVDLGSRIRSEIDKINNDESATKFVINQWMQELGNEERTSNINGDGTGYIFLNDINKVVEIATKSFKTNDDPESMKILAYRNSSITTLNDVLRAQTHGTEKYIVDDELLLPQFMYNELVICDGGYGKRGEIYNNQTFKVIGSKEVIGPSGIPCLALSLNPHVSMMHNEEIYCVDYEKGRHAYWAQLNELKNQAKNTKRWKPFYDFKAQFAHFDYNYAQNAFKSQGRTYTDVIVFENDIITIKKNSLKNKLQALYVNCTRAKNIVFIYNKKYAVNQENLPQQIREKYGI